MSSDKFTKFNLKWQ